MQQYLTVDELLKYISEHQRTPCEKLLNDNRLLFEAASGSTNNHQAWKGGYLDHVEETMNAALVLYDTLHALRPLPFKKSDALISLYLHDLEKPFKKKKNISFKTKEEKHKFRMDKINEYYIPLTLDQENAILYAEGELDDYTNTKRTMLPLATFCHMCDVLSARLWFDFPKKEVDGWRIL